MLGFSFANAVLNRDLAESNRKLAEVEARSGKRAVVLLALVSAATRMFPAVKYALGHGRACSPRSGCWGRGACCAGSDARVNKATLLVW